MKLTKNPIVKLAQLNVQNVLITKLAQVAKNIITYTKTNVSKLVQMDIGVTHPPELVNHVTPPVPLVPEEQTITVLPVLLDYS